MREIPLTRGQVALVDDEDYEYLSQFKWHAYKDTRNARTRWYARRGASPQVYMHAEIMQSQAGQKVDHQNENGLDNQRSNLRFATAAQNAHNTGLKSTNTSGYRGAGLMVGWSI